MLLARYVSSKLILSQIASSFPHYKKDLEKIGIRNCRVINPVANYDLIAGVVTSKFTIFTS